MKVPCANEHDLVLLALAHLHEKREKLIYAGEPLVPEQDEVIGELASVLYETEHPTHP